MKSISLLCLLLFLAGCATNSRLTHTAAVQRASTIYAYQSNQGMCYARYLQQMPLDQVCVDGENVRYSASSDASQLTYLPMPRTVEALFDSIAVERVIQHRYSLKGRNTGDRAIN